MYAFYPNGNIGAHMSAIRHLREHMDDIPTFIHALSILVYMEPDMDEGMLDLYFYYCSIGMEHSSETLRAATIAMLVALLAYSPELVLSTLPALASFATRTAWWEVKAQLIIVCSAILKDIQDNDKEEPLGIALDILQREFHPKASVPLRKLGLSYIAKNLADYQELVPVYVDVLLSMPCDTLEEETTEELGLVGTSGGKYRLIHLPSEWDSLNVARQVWMDYLTGDERPATVRPFQVLVACFHQLASTHREHIGPLYEEVQEAVVRAMADPEMCAYACEIVSCTAFYTTVTHLDVLEDGLLLDVCCGIASSDLEETRGIAVDKMLKEIATTNDQNASSVASFLTRMQAKEPCFQGSIFELLLVAMNTER